MTRTDKEIKVTISQYLAADGKIPRPLYVFLMQRGWKFRDWAMSEIIYLHSLFELIKLEKDISDFFKDDVRYKYYGLRLSHSEYDDGSLQLKVMSERL